MAAAGSIVVGLTLVPGAQARTSCLYEGAPANRLTVTVTGFEMTEIRRRGQEIVVANFLDPPTRCSGGVPTVLSTDAIRVLVRGRPGADVDLHLSGGQFAPGATPEAEGASEIEIEVSGRAAFADVVGGPRADQLHWAPAGTGAGLNVNPGTAGDRDVDVTVTGEDALLSAQGGGGSDSIVPAPGAAIPSDAGIDSSGGRGDDVLIVPRSTFGLLGGGRGDDVLTGGNWADQLGGQGGADRIAGGGRGDRIDGGPGRDLLTGGRGEDRITARDRTRDVVRCGPGRDRVEADPGDRLRGCEVIRR
jgi:hypothetical protein